MASILDSSVRSFPAASYTSTLPATMSLSAAATLTAVDNGKVIQLSDGGAAYTVTLPNPEDVVGMSIVVAAAEAITNTITLSTGSNDDFHVNWVTLTDGTPNEILTMTAQHNTVQFVANNAAAGDQVELVSNGVKWCATMRAVLITAVIGDSS